MPLEARGDTGRPSLWNLARDSGPGDPLVLDLWPPKLREYVLICSGGHRKGTHRLACVWGCPGPVAICRRICDLIPQAHKPVRSCSALGWKGNPKVASASWVWSSEQEQDEKWAYL